MATIRNCVPKQIWFFREIPLNPMTDKARCNVNDAVSGVRMPLETIHSCSKHVSQGGSEVNILLKLSNKV
jgi:hypothetical protein